MDVSLFEEFARMALEEFGCVVEKSMHREDTFESLFGIKLPRQQEFDLPYQIAIQPLEFFNEVFIDNTNFEFGFEAQLPVVFDASACLPFAA